MSLRAASSEDLSAAAQTAIITFESFSHTHKMRELIALRRIFRIRDDKRALPPASMQTDTVAIMLKRAINYVSAPSHTPGKFPASWKEVCLIKNICLSQNNTHTQNVFIIMYYPTPLTILTININAVKL